MLKLNSSLVFLLVLVFSSLVLSSNVIAVVDDGLVLEAELQDVNSMTWPMLPGENLNDVAHLFYPKNQAMQRQFVAKTLRLSTNIQANLKPEKRFEEPTLLVIPTLKSLSPIKKITRKKPRKQKQKLQLSYDIDQAMEQVPAKLLQDYEWLVSKNAFLKEELAKLNKKIIFLQTKLDGLKLIFDKTLNLANTGLPSTDSQSTDSQSTDLPGTASASADLPATNMPAKKLFKNLSNTKLEVEIVNKKSNILETMTARTPAAENATFSNTNLIIVAIASLVMLIAAALALKKYRQHMFASFTNAIPIMSDSLQDFGGHWKDEAQELDQQTLQDLEKVIHNTEAKAAHPRGVIVSTLQNKLANTIQPNTIQTNLADSTLVEAKLLMSINRNQDAIKHLKVSIESNPKVSINHWLYLLEIFRTLNLKEEFEKYAAGLKANFNVTTQEWDDSIAPSALPQFLEEFPNIIENLCAVWPSNEAKVYLRSLITDNRDGERAGFGKSVLSEILFLVALLDTRKDFN